MSTYIISSHGTVDWGGSTTIPQNTSVLFYTPFGMQMPNDMGFQIQAALAWGQPMHYGTKALWNSGEQKPYIALTGDMNLFNSGIVRVDGQGNNQVILNLGNKQLVSLTYALNTIRTHQPNGQINVHCLFCL